MRWFVAICIVMVSLYGTEVEFHGIKLSKNFQNKIKIYWGERETQDYNADKLYNTELPYLRFLYTKSEYKSFVPPIEFEKIIFDKIFLKNGDKIELGGWIITFDGEKHYFHDLWVRMDNKWYHRFNDRLLPF